MALEMEKLESYKQKYNDLLPKYDAIVAEQMNATTDTKTTFIKLNQMHKRLNTEKASHEKTKQMNKVLMEIIEMEKAAYEQQMQKCCKQNEIKIKKVYGEMSEQICELIHELHEHQEAAIRAKEMANGMIEEMYDVRNKINAKNWEIAKLQRKLSLCMANINKMNALIKNYKQCNCKYKSKIQYLKPKMIKQFKQYKFVTANNEIAPVQMGKRKYEKNGNDVVNSMKAFKRLHLRKN